MFQKTNQIIWRVGILLLVISACQSPAVPGTQATPGLSSAVTSSPVPATPPTRVIGPANAAQVTRRAQLGNGMIYSELKLSPNGKTLAVPTTIGVDLYDTETLTRIRTLPTGGYTTDVAFSPDGNLLAADAAGGDRVQLWDVSDGSLLRELTTNSEDVEICMDLAFSPDGKTLASGYSLRAGNQAAETWLWNVEDGKLRQRLQGGYWLAYAPDGKRLLTMQLDPAAARRRIIRVYDPADGSLIKQWEGRRATFSPSGALAIEQDDAVRIWDFEQARAVWAFSGKNAAFSAQGDRLALFSREKVEVYNLVDGTHLQTLQGNYTYAETLLFSSEGDGLAGMVSTDGWGQVNEMGDALALWRISDGAVIKTMDGAQPYVFTPDGKRLVVPHGHSVDFLQTSDGTVVASLGGYTYSVAGIAFSPDGQTLAAAEGDGVQLWQMADLQPLQRLDNQISGGEYNDRVDVAFSPDGKILAERNDLWRLPNGELMKELRSKMFEDHSFVPASMAFWPDGQNITIGSFDGYLASWNIIDQKLQYKFEAAPLTGRVISLDVARDGTKLAAVYDWPTYVVQIWQFPEGTSARVLSGEHFTRAIFSPDGQTLATIAVAEELEQYGQQVGPVHLWRVRDRQELLHLDLRDAFDLAFSPDGQILATGSNDGSVRLWRVRDGQLLQTLKGQTDRISDLAFSPDGTLLASGSRDGTVLLWGLPEQ